MQKKILIGADHYGFELAQDIIKILKEIFGLDSMYFGSNGEADKLLLQDFIKPVCDHVIQEDGYGILICGTGVGVNIGANKMRGIRACLCKNAKDVNFARKYDDINILCLSSWDMIQTEITDILRVFLETPCTNETVKQSLYIMDNWK